MSGLRDPSGQARPVSIRARVGYQPPGWEQHKPEGQHGILRFLLFTVVLAAIVLGLLITVGRPLLVSAVVGWAGNNPSAMRYPFVADLVRDDLGPKLTSAPSTDAASLPFTIESGDTLVTIASRLAKAGFLLDERAFVLESVDQDVADTFKAGNYVLRKNMTPKDLLATLQAGPPPNPLVTIGLREGLRLEQITAKLELLQHPTDGSPALKMDPRAFYDLAKNPPASLIDSYPWLQIPAGASLQGFLGAATYQVKPDVTPDAFVRMLLDSFYQSIGPERMTVLKARGLTFYQVLSLASIVEQEAVVDEERPLIAGVYQNRINRKMLLQADPTVIYANDTVQLDALDFDDWVRFSFWNVPKSTAMADVEVPSELQGFQTYQTVGLIPGPICTPTAASIDAALDPDTKTGYLFFLAKNDGSRTHAFAKTPAEHLANLLKYGYIK
jgi:UPF0755 protein